MLMVLTLIFSITISMAQSQTMSDKPKYFTIFDPIGKMASGMAYIHVAIPLNITTFKNQADILENYLFKLSRVVDSNTTDRNEFLQNIREIANFGQIKLERLKNRIKHIDQILPFDGDLTTRQQRQRRDETDINGDDEIIDYLDYIDNKVHSPIELDHIIRDQDSLKNRHKYLITMQLLELEKEHEAFVKKAKQNNHYRFKRNTKKPKVAQFSLMAGLTGFLGEFNYTHDYTTEYQSQINKEVENLRAQQFRILQIRTAIHAQIMALNDELHAMTNIQWTPDMDKIIGRDQFDTLQQKIKMFEHHITQVATDNYHILREHRTFNDRTTNNVTRDIDNTTLVGTMTNTWTRDRSRQKRGFSISDKDAYIDFKDEMTIKITEQYRELQIDINELLIQTTSDIMDYMTVAKRVDNYKKLQRKGTKTEFFNFDDIFNETPNSTSTRQSNDHIRRKRVAPLLVGGAVLGITGVLGTFMGMYNTYEITQLKDRLAESEKNHNLLVHVTKRQEEQIHRITENMNAIVSLIKLMSSKNPALIAEQISAQISLLEARLTMATNAVQQLQHRRLAIDYLDTWQLEEMHAATSNIAKERGYTLMPEKVSDYFQVEASYLRNGQDIIIMLHVPCIVHEQLLTIYRYIPLPFPIPKLTNIDKTTIADLYKHRMGDTMQAGAEEMDALMIVPEAELIAVSHDDKFQVLSQSDLASCIKRNKIYLCENHQVLHTDLSNSCLGSIYSNFEQGIKMNCRAMRKPLAETVYQLSPTNYLVFTPAPYKTTIECKNGANIPVFLTKIYQLHVPEDCKITLKSHEIQSDFNIRINPAPLDIPWSLDPMDLPADILLDAAIIDDKMKTLDTDLKILLNETSKKTDFDKMLNKGMSSPSSYPWFFWLTVIVACSAMALLAFWYIFNTIQSRKQLLLATKNNIASAPNNDTNNLYPKFNL